MTNLGYLTTMIHPQSLPQGWQLVRIKDVALINPRRPASLNRAEDAPTSFVPMETVDSVTGTIANRITRPFGEIKYGYTYFSEGDVLFAKITPCMQNGKSAIASDLIDGIGFGSTEFHVLRPMSAMTPEWIHHFLRQPALLLEATNHFTGAVGQQRLPVSYLEELEIPLPPLQEQKRIIKVLNEQMAEVGRARAAAEARLDAVKALPAMFIREIFDGQEIKKWTRKKIGQITEITARQVDPKIEEFGKLPHVNGENIESGTCKLLYLNTAAEENMTSGKYLFEAGTVLYSKLRPYLRKVVVVDFKGLCSADVYPIKTYPNELDPNYLAWVLLSDEFSQYAESQSQRARMPKLNRDQLFTWEIPLPPLELQKKNVMRVQTMMDYANNIIKMANEELSTINALPAAMLRIAFDGEL